MNEIALDSLSPREQEARGAGAQLGGLARASAVGASLPGGERPCPPQRLTELLIHRGPGSEQSGGHGGEHGRGADPERVFRVLY